MRCPMIGARPAHC